MLQEQQIGELDLFKIASVRLDLKIKLKIQLAYKILITLAFK